MQSTTSMLCFSVIRAQDFPLFARCTPTFVNHQHLLSNEEFQSSGICVIIIIQLRISCLIKRIVVYHCRYHMMICFCRAVFVDVTIIGEGLQILTYARQLWPLSSEGSLEFYTFCDTGHTFIIHFRGPVTLIPIAERFTVELSLPVLTTLVCRGWDSNNQPSACGANALTHCATATVPQV